MFICVTCRAAPPLQPVKEQRAKLLRDEHDVLCALDFDFIVNLPYRPLKAMFEAATSARRRARGRSWVCVS